MKIERKIFCLLSVLVVIILFGIWAVNALYLERFYIGKQKEKLLGLGRVLTDPSYIVDLQNIEMNSNVSISIKNIDDLYAFENTSMMSRSEIENIKKLLLENKMIFSEITLLDYRGKTLMLFVPYKNDTYFEIFTPLNFLEDGIAVSTTYHLRIIGIAFVLGILMAFWFSKKITDPLIKIRNITENISNLDFHEKFEDTKRKDEIGEIGRSLNKMSGTLQQNIKEINDKNAILKKDIENDKRLENLRKDFIANVSHELKTPLAIIQGYAQGLSENIVSKDDMDFYCSTIIEESKKMNDLVQELLLVSKMESRHLTLKLEKVDYYDSLDETIKKYSKEGRNIIYHGPKSINVVCEERYIDRVMDNFIVNAMKYSVENSDIVINVVEEETTYKVSVENETDRLNEEDIKNIWTPFYRKETARDREGHGLGLAIVKGILENHKCEFGTELNGKLVQFWFRLHKDFVEVNEEVI